MGLSINASHCARRVPASTKLKGLPEPRNTEPATRPRSPHQQTHTQAKSITMSDFEDDMDIDVAPSKDITFSADTTKGKRSAANLPVEAEDSLPW